MVATRERLLTIEFQTAMPCVAGRTDFALLHAGVWGSVYVSTILQVKLYASKVWPCEYFINVVTNDPNISLPVRFTT